MTDQVQVARIGVIERDIVRERFRQGSPIPVDSRDCVLPELDANRRVRSPRPKLPMPDQNRNEGERKRGRDQTPHRLACAQPPEAEADCQNGQDQPQVGDLIPADGDRVACPLGLLDALDQARFELDLQFRGSRQSSAV